MFPLDSCDCWRFLPDLRNRLFSAVCCVVDAKHHVLLDNTTSLQAHGIYTCTASLGISPTELQQPFSSVVNEFFAMTVLQMPSTTSPYDVQHYIIIKDPPVIARLPRLLPKRLSATNAEFEYLLRLGIIRSLSSPRATPNPNCSEKATATGVLVVIIMHLTMPDSTHSRFL